MELTCNTDELLKACQRAGAAVAPRTTMPILSNLKFEAENGILTVTGTDQDVGIRCTLGSDIRDAGRCVLKPKCITDILRESGAETTKISVDSKEAHVLTGGNRYKLAINDADAFPDFPAFDAGEHYHEVMAGVLRKLIKRTVFAADKKEGTRWAVTGLLWGVKADSLSICATDTKRLALATGPAVVYGGIPDKKNQTLIPRRTIELVERHLGSDSDLIKVVTTNNSAMFSGLGWTIHSKLVEGRFPPAADVIPKKCSVKINIDTATFASRVRQAAIMSDTEGCRVDFTFDAGKLTLQARGADIGSSEVTMPIDYDGKALDVAMDPDYVKELLRSVDVEAVTLEMTDGSKPVVIKDGSEYTYLIMPMGG